MKDNNSAEYVALFFIVAVAVSVILISTKTSTSRGCSVLGTAQNGDVIEICDYGVHSCFETDTEVISCW